VEQRAPATEDGTTMIAIINGGTQGLGEAVARKLVSDGNSTGLVITGRSAERGGALAEELTGLGGPTLFVPADIAEPGTPGRVVAACVERFGTVHGLVNVAALTTWTATSPSTSRVPTC
jgi:NAD(P)-dependent dehydrogenase (short-subunit alcohol dehydrogenase family)